MGEQVDEIVADVARQLHEVLPSLTSGMTDLFVEVIPEFRQDDLLRRLMVASTAANVAAIVNMLAHGIAPQKIPVPAAAAEYARRFAQLDLSLEALLRAYRLGEHQLVVGAISMIEQIDEPIETADALAATAEIAGRANRYIDQVIEALIEIYEAERREWDSRAGSARAVAIRTVLETESLSLGAAQALVEVPLDGFHQAAIIWSTDGTPSTEALRRTTHLLEECSGCQPVTMMADDRTQWAWLSSARPPALDVAELRKRLEACPDVVVCLGGVGAGLDGFRGTIREAQRARTIVGGLDRPAQVTEFDDVAVVALMTADLADVRRWTDRMLPGLTGDDAPSVQLRETIKVFLETNGSYTQAASRLHLHKNTVHYRIRKAEELIGCSLMGNRLSIEVAVLALEQVTNRA